MASEDLFANYSDEIVSENVNNVEDEHEIYEETEDMTGGADYIEEAHETEDTAGNAIAEQSDKATKPAQSNEREAKLFQLPMARVRNLMKLDPDLNIASHEAAFLVTRATELFIESLARESYRHTAQSKKKTVQKRDVDMAISAVDSLMFLEGAMNF